MATATPVRVKMYVSALIPCGTNQTNITMSAVYSTDPANPNKAFTDATPYGQFNLVIQNDKVPLGKFQMMREFHVDILPVVAPEEPNVPDSHPV